MRSTSFMSISHALLDAESWVAGRHYAMNGGGEMMLCGINQMRMRAGHLNRSKVQRFVS